MPIYINIIYCSNKGRVLKRNVIKGVTVSTSYKLTVVRKVHLPSVLPEKLGKHIFYSEDSTHRITEDISLSGLRISSSADDFLDNNYKRGGMIPIKDVKRCAGWKPEYMKDIDVKFVNMCKSCRSRAYKGCCLQYSHDNRKKIKMVIGWSYK